MSSSDCLSDLICEEDSGSFDEEDSPRIELPLDIEESIIGLMEEEGDYLPQFNYLEKFQSQTLDVLARLESVEWILKVYEFYHFQPLTAYLAINYMDRFLAFRRLPQANGWQLQLLSVSCLSLAAKVEETLVPNLLDLQVEGTKFIFEPRTIRRMELLVLDTLDWRLRSITPFDFINFFAYKVHSDSTCIGFLVARTTQMILATLRDIRFLNYLPSSIAAAAVLGATNEIPHLPLLGPGNAETWCEGLSKERILSCYLLMQEVVVGKEQRKRPKVLPQLRVMTHTEFDYGDSSSSSSSFTKKRKLNNSIDRDKP